MVALILSVFAINSSNYDYDYTETYKIGILISGDERLAKISGLTDGLYSLGFIDGINVMYIMKDSRNSLEIMKRYANDLGQMDLDVIVTGGAIETKYLQENKKVKAPIVFLGVADAINLGFVESYQKPNGRITGVENAHVELSAKRLQLFKLLIPTLERIIVIYDENIDASLLSLSRVKEAAEDLNIPLLPISIKDEQQLNQFKEIQIQDNDGLLVLPSYFLEDISNDLGKFALENKVPIFGVNLNDVKNGFLLSYGVSYYDQGYQGASMVSQILNGLNPSEIPVEKPNAVRLLVNPLTEKELDIVFSKAGNAFINRITISE